MEGMAQNVQDWSQPSEILRYAYGGSGETGAGVVLLRPDPDSVQGLQSAAAERRPRTQKTLGIGGIHQTEPTRHLRDPFLQLLPVPLHQATHHQHLPVPILPASVEDDGDRLLLGVGYETARVYEDVGRLRRVGLHISAGSGQSSGHGPAVGLVLGTAQSMDVDPREKGRRRAHATLCALRQPPSPQMSQRAPQEYAEHR